MFQFPGFAFVPYVFRYKYLLLISASPKTRIPCKPTLSSVHEIVVFGITEIEGGFPHSEIRGSKLVRSSPRLIAAYHVLHRLSAPRHPPDTLKALDRSHYRCPPLGRVDAILSDRSGLDRKTSLLRTYPGALRSSRAHCDCLLVFGQSEPADPERSFSTPRATKVDRIRFLFTMLNNPRFDHSNRETCMDAAVPGSGVWWSQTGSNRRPHACKARALPTELWPRSRTRKVGRVVGLGGLEPPTSRLSSARSNQLSYKPEPSRRMREHPTGAPTRGRREKGESLLGSSMGRKRNEDGGRPAKIGLTGRVS